MLLAIDQGRTGTTCLVFDLQSELIGRAYREFMGAALLAGVGAGLLTLDQVSRIGSERARYEPSMDADEREIPLDGWHRALERSRGWASE
jgi:glycerol kinase